MEVEIWSDVACPWCYVGKRRLEAALEQKIPHGARAVFIVDPSYEIKSEYETIPDFVAALHKQRPAAIILIWAPMLPANTGPADTPMPKSTRSRRNSSPNARAVARAADAGSSMRSGAPNTASAASPWNLLIRPSRLSTCATTMRKKSLSTAATSCGSRVAGLSDHAGR